MAKKPRILFVTSEGVCRGLMAEGFARYLAGSLVDLETAGSEKSASDSYTQWAMNEAGIDLAMLAPSSLDSKTLSSYTHLVTMDEGARQSCSSVPSGIELEHWEIPDPSTIRGRPLERIVAVRSIRNQIERRVRQLLSRALGRVPSAG